VQTLSLWEHTLTFFPQFNAALAQHAESEATVAVVGASDGKFVIPLAAAGHRVIAIEGDPVALHGGTVRLPDGTEAHSAGLIERLEQERLDDRVRIIEGDFLALDSLADDAQCDAVWTSCSWHYSANRHRPLTDFVTRMQALVRAGGLFGAEFMMPVTVRHHRVEHYTTPEKLGSRFATGWEIRLTLQTGQFMEAPHLDHPEPHIHRMGLLLATRSSH